MSGGAERPPGHEPALPHEARAAFARAFEERDAVAVRELVSSVRDGLFLLLLQ